MKAVTIQSNKIVLNAVKDDQALLEPSYKKEKEQQMKLLANPMCKVIVTVPGTGEVLFPMVMEITICINGYFAMIIISVVLPTEVLK